MLKRTLLLGLSLFALTAASLAQALQFNGSSDYVKVPDNKNLQLRGFTLEAWIYITGPGATTGTGQGFAKGTVVPLITKGRGDKESTSALSYFFGYRASDRKLVADFTDSTALKANHPFVGDKSIPFNTWTHVAVTYAKAGQWKMYINGVLDATLNLRKAFVPQALSNVNVAIGSALNAAGTPEGFFKGKMDEVRIWNIVRSYSQIMAGHNQELSYTYGLVGRYSFNENSGKTAANSTGRTPGGTLINNPLWTKGFNGFVVNKAPDAPVNPALESSSMAMTNNNATSADLCVTVNDPEQKPVTVSYYARKKTSTKKFTVVLLPDPQYYVAEPQGTGYIKGAYNIMFKTQTKWIAANREARNIVYVGGLGDCSDHGDRFEKEWKRGDTAMKSIEDPLLTGLPEGIPYGLPVGNHDQAPRGDANGTTHFYNKYFGVSRFEGRSYYGGHYGKDNDNHYQFFTASGINFLVICPEWDMSSQFSAPGRVLDWMENLVKTYPNHKVIILSHYLINLSSSFTPQGRAIYNRLKTYPNLMLMAAGHIVNEATGAGEARRSDTTDGRVVHTITQDYQARLNGGNGFLRIYEFDPQNNKVAVQTYSPFINMYERDANSEFTLDVDLGAPTADTAAFQLVERKTNVPSGSTVCFNWTGLEPNSEYEWYARVYDGQYSVKGENNTFSTGGSTARSNTATNVINPTTTATAATGRAMESLQEEGAPKGITVFPNPNSTKFISIGLPEALPNGNIEIYNISGQVMLNRRINNPGKVITFEHNLPAGMYKVVVRKSDNAVLSTSNFLINR